MDRDQIKRILPHREPMLLVDSVEITHNKQRDTMQAHGTYTVRGDEFFLQGHFPGNPVVPGVILCEMMAQTCCVLFGEEVKDATPMFTGLDNVKFKNPARPNDTLEFTCEITKRRGMFYFASGTGHVDGAVCVKGDFSFAIVPNEKSA